ncbi:DUF58 domain-containing protein [Nitrosophilus kaiyonis]|uniref:DUF58 domain-containing protein n=1 Tax=Nitrosophilus kaiyonis TaxID=2930200 RepID=UPI002492C51F|nr:DUF58 domain-containing protein [Nitrosophilus kaiyonis]
MDKKIKKILIKTKRQVFSEISGNNPSIFKGEGFNFIELREYLPGDDVKKIDWLISAKLQKPYVKVYQEERELNIIVAFMLNGSMYFGSVEFKHIIAAAAGAIIGFSAIKNQDSFSYYIFADKLYKSIKSTKNINAIQEMIENIANFNPLGKSDNFKDLTKRLFKIKRKSLIFIISDFLEDFDFKLLSKKHEVIAIIIRDRLEEEPKEFGFVNLIDPQSGDSAVLDMDSYTKNEYKKEIKRKDHFMYEHFKKNRIRFTKIYTDEEPFIKLLKLFGRR